MCQFLTSDPQFHPWVKIVKGEVVQYEEGEEKDQVNWIEVSVDKGTILDYP